MFDTYTGYVADRSATEFQILGAGKYQIRLLVYNNRLIAIRVVMTATTRIYIQHDERVGDDTATSAGLVRTLLQQHSPSGGP